ncbi:MAG: hypothetical protein U0939_04275 [Pirellulales bacterium]
MQDKPFAFADYNVIMLTFHGSNDHIVLVRPELKEIGGRGFVVGTIPADALPGFRDKVSGVAWDIIEQVIILDSVSDYEECLAKWRNSRRRKWWQW